MERRFWELPDWVTNRDEIAIQVERRDTDVVGVREQNDLVKTQIYHVTPVPSITRLSLAVAPSCL